MEKSIKIKFITYSLLCLARVDSYFLSCCKLQFRLVGVEAKPSNSQSSIHMRMAHQEFGLYQRSIFFCCNMKRTVLPNFDFCKHFFKPFIAKHLQFTVLLEKMLSTYNPTSLQKQNGITHTML